MSFSVASSTETLPLNLNQKGIPKKPQNQNESTEFSYVQTSFVSNNVVIIILSTMLTMFVIAVCAFCYSCISRRKGLQRRKNVSDEPNAPGRRQLEEAFELQRRAMLVPQREPVDLGFTIFQSESSSFGASLSRWASIRNLPKLHSSETAALQKDKQPTSYATTPRSVFPAFSQKWSESSAKRLDHLRTKLVARFPSSSSHSTSDISVFFSTSSRNSEWGDCSQLNSDEERDVLSDVEAGKKKSRSSSFNKCIPSIVIEFVK